MAWSWTAKGITGAVDEHASVLFEVMFRKNNDLRGNNKIEG